MFRAELQPGVAYYWNIPTPPALLKDGKLVGGFKLTAILEPLRSKTGTENYFASRLETNLQFKNRQNKTQAILGKLDENEGAEQEARTDHRKWSQAFSAVQDSQGVVAVRRHDASLCASVHKGSFPVRLVSQ